MPHAVSAADPTRLTTGAGSREPGAGSREPGFVRVPVGEEAAHWVTVPAQRTLLAVARTVTSTARVLDAVQLLRDDPRVQVVFSFNDTSPFNDGVLPLLERAGARLVPWNRLGELTFDAALTCSENTEFRAFDAPALVLQHGAGFHKILPDSRGEGRRLAGTVRAADLRGRRVTVAVTHPAQIAQLAAAEPAAADRAVLITDPMLERLRAARLLRHRYRTALGLGDRRLVVLSSTWGRTSLLGRAPDLPARLLAQLDAGTHAVASVLHPNITAGHGALQLRLWLAAARDAGLLAVPPEAGWQAMLATADCVVGDHSSVSLLAAATGIPLLLAPLSDEVVPGTPMTALSEAAVRLDLHRPLAAQVAAAIDGHTPDRYAAAVTATFAEPPVTRPLRSVLYDLLALPEPDGPAPLVAFPPPVPETTPVHSYEMRTRVTADRIEIERFPAAVRRHVRPPAEGWTGHLLSAADQEWDLRLLQNAEVLTQATGDPDVLVRFPGAALACTAVPEGIIAELRDGRRAIVSGQDVTALAACAYALARAGALTDGTWRAGDDAISVRLLPGL
ncbi:hypothetical protein [Actinoplanes sp. NPDC051851]|uniref:hypothetical protein n=1 Tax=Actinoplanes sp. NPDC051851 TaxID=3154753 RepID=UPI0034216C6F